MNGNWVVHAEDPRTGTYGHAYTLPSESIRQPYQFRDRRFETPYYKPPHSVNKPHMRRQEKPVMELVPDFRTGILTPPKQYQVRMQIPAQYIPPQPQLEYKMDSRPRPSKQDAGEGGVRAVHQFNSDYNKQVLPIEPASKQQSTKLAVKRRKSKRTKVRPRKDAVFVYDNAKQFYPSKPKSAPLPHAETISEADTNWRQTYEKFDLWIKSRLEALDNLLTTE